jgi:hypothetical protein
MLNVKADVLCVVALPVWAGCPLFGHYPHGNTDRGRCLLLGQNGWKRPLAAGETYDKHALTAATHKRAGQGLVRGHAKEK